MKINYIDNYDSFANSIAAYFRIAGAEVTMYESDCSLETAVSDTPDLIVLGPGPSGPREAGNYLELLDTHHKEFPFFGICLGFQAMMEYFGQHVTPLEDIVHGASVPIEHTEQGIFYGIRQHQVFARYNSLGVYQVPECFRITAISNRIIMAAEHRSLPIEGVQFHPESVLSTANDDGMRLIRNVVHKYANRDLVLP